MNNFKIGTFRATALVASNMIGSGVLLAPALLAPYGYATTIIGWIITTIGALSLALVFSQLANWIPNSGGPYIYVRNVFGNFLGFQMAWGYWISSWCGSISLLIGTLQYISIFYPNFANNQLYSIIFGLGIILLFTYINMKGIKETTSASIIILIIKVIPLLLIAFVGIFFIKNFDIFSFQNIKLSSLNNMSCILLWSFIGLESATIPSDNVNNPERTIPASTITGVLITAAVYIFGTIAIFGILSESELVSSPAPYVDAARKIAGNYGEIFMIVTGIAGLVGSLNGWIMIQGQVPYSAAKEGLFPKIFLKVNKNNVPVGVIISSILMGIVFILSYQESITQHLKLLIDVSVLAMLLPYFYSVVAYIYLSVTQKKQFSLLKKIFFSIIGLTAILYSFIAIISAGQEMVFICFIIFLISVPFYGFVKWNKK